MEFISNNSSIYSWNWTMWITGFEAVGRYYQDHLIDTEFDEIDDAIMLNLCQCKIFYNTETKLLKAAEPQTIH
jgi:hypothetical protein